MCFNDPSEKKLTLTSGYIPVFKNDDDRITWAYDPIRGMYCLGFEDVRRSTEYVSALWPREFSDRTGWLDVREPPYLIYEREGTNPFTDSPYKIHIVRDGKTYCNRKTVSIPPDSEEFTPVSELSEEQIGRIRWQMCANCPSIDDILPKVER
jgi:hypothetical protein